MSFSWKHIAICLLAAVVLAGVPRIAAAQWGGYE